MIIYKLHNTGAHYDRFYEKGKSNYFLRLEDAIEQFKKTHPEIQIVKESWDKTNTKYRLYEDIGTKHLFCYESILKIEVNE